MSEGDVEGMSSGTGADTNSVLERTSTVPPWVVVEAGVVGPWRLRVRFADGQEGLVDMQRRVFGEHAGVFASLRDPELLNQVHVFMDAVAWPGGLDLAPDAMHAAIAKDGIWHPG